MARLTQIDYDREMALIAVVEMDGRSLQICVARYAQLPDPEACEFAIVIADEWQGKGLARPMMEALIEAARYPGYKRMVGTVLTVP